MNKTWKRIRKWIYRVFLDESRILDVTWQVVYCSKGYLLSIHSQHDGSEDDDGIDGAYMRHERIEGDDRNMP